MFPSTLSGQKALYLKAIEAYYNGEAPIMSDSEYDLLEDEIKRAHPKWVGLSRTGVLPEGNSKKSAVKLQQFMPSLNKAYPKDLLKWKLKNPADQYVVMPKLDGTSLLLTWVDGRPTHLVTRGDGETGKDVSFLLPHIHLPSFKSSGTVSARVEAILSKTIYRKWAKLFADPRSMVNGIFNRLEPHPALKDVTLFVLGVYGRTLPAGLKPFINSGNHQLKAIPFSQVSSDHLTSERAVKKLSALRNSFSYEIDGLVFAPSDFVLSYRNTSKPKNIIAFKVNYNEDAVSVKVAKIIYQITGRKRIVPKIYIEPTKIGGVIVKHAAAHNAQWMIDRKIGPGALVKIVRSGGVIPKIIEVLKPGKFQEPEMPYVLDGCHFVLLSEVDAPTDRRVRVLNTVKFMKTLGIELVAGKTASTLFDVGLQTPNHYMLAFKNGKLKSLLHRAGFEGKQGIRIFKEIERVFGSTIHLKHLMVALQVFGVGIGLKKLSQIEQHGISMSTVLSAKPSNLKSLLAKVPGYNEKTISLIHKGLFKWQGAYRVAKGLGFSLNGDLPTKTKSLSNRLANLKVSFTSYRNKEHENWILENGGEVVPFGSKTNILLFKKTGKLSSKISKAKESGQVEVLTFDELKKFKS